MKITCLSAFATRDVDSAVMGHQTVQFHMSGEVYVYRFKLRVVGKESVYEIDDGGLDHFLVYYLWCHFPCVGIYRSINFEVSYAERFQR